MPITVRRGGEMSDALAQLAILMGANQAQVPQMPQWRPAPVTIPGGRGGGRTGTSGGDIGRPGGMGLRYSGPSQEEQLRELAYAELKAKEFGMEVKREEAMIEAEAQAEQLELELSVKDEQRLAAAKAAKQRLIANPAFSNEEKMAGIRAIELETAGIAGTIPSKKFKWPKITGVGGQEIQTGVGITWEDPRSGALVTGILDRQGNPSVKTVQQFGQGREAARVEAEQKEIERIWKAQAEQQKRNDEFIQDLITEEIERPDPKVPALKIKQRRKPEEIQEIMQDYLRMTGQIKGRAVEDAQWAQRAIEQGLLVEEGDLEMGESVGYSQALLRTYANEYDNWNDMPSEKKVLAREAKKEVDRYRASRKR